MVANHALSQLSYSPVTHGVEMSDGRHNSVATPDVGLSRVELLTSRLSGVRSNHLSYRPITKNEMENSSRYCLIRN